MSLFLKRLFTFIFAILLVSSVVFFTTLWWLRSGSFYRVPYNATSLVLGHSHSACAVDDSIVRGVYNVSQFTEGYPYSYFKAKLLLEDNPQLKNIFVEFTNNQIGYWAKERIFGTYMSINMERMLPFVDLKFVIKAFLASNDLSCVLESIIKSFQKAIQFIFSDSENFVALNWHSLKAPEHVFDGDSLRKERNLKEFVNYFEVQEENIRYLFVLKQLCQRSNIKLILIRSPLSPKMRNDINEPLFQLIRETYFYDVPFLDFSSYPMQQRFFADDSHLNLDGSIEFSKFFSEVVMNNIQIEKTKLEQLVKNELDTIKNE